MFPKLEEGSIEPTCIVRLRKRHVGEPPAQGPIKTKFGSAAVTTRPLRILPQKTATLGQLDSEVEREWWGNLGSARALDAWK